METCVIFGASGGIGRHLVKILRQRGARAIGVSRTSTKLDNADLGLDLCLVSDYSVESIDQAFHRVSEEFGAPTGVCNLAGSVLLKPLHLTSLAEFQGVLEANLLTAFVVARSAVRHFGDKGGSLVLCSSAASQLGLSNHEAIAAAKGAISAMARSAAATYAHKDIRVNCIAPGLTRTPLTERITSNDAGMRASLAMHPLGRLGEADDIARAIAFLLDPAQSWITGQTLAVDGGLGSLKTLQKP